MSFKWHFLKVWTLQTRRRPPLYIHQLKYQNKLTLSTVCDRCNVISLALWSVRLTGYTICIYNTYFQDTVTTIVVIRSSPILGTRKEFYCGCLLHIYILVLSDTTFLSFLMISAFGGALSTGFLPPLDTTLLPCPHPFISR